MDRAALINGTAVEIPEDSQRTLLSLLRDELGLTGAKPACDEGACGACTVLLDGEPVRACATTAGAVCGHVVTTVEVSESRVIRALQEAFAEGGAMQCGYCTPGMLMAAAGLLSHNPDPDGPAIRAALNGNLCRCGGYVRIEQAILRAAAALRTSGQEPATSEPPASPSFWDFTPRVPWDLARPHEREYFRLLGDGVAFAVEPPRPEEVGLRAAPVGGSAWLHVACDGSVTAFTGKVEMGQDTRTALTLLVSEELGLAPETVRLVMGDTDLCPFDTGTFASRSMRDAGDDLLRCAAAARQWLEEQGTPRPGVHHLEVSEAGAVPRPPAERPASGASRPRLTAGRMVTGRHRFPTDLTLPDMLHAAVLRPPSYGARLQSVDMSRVDKMPGVIVARHGELLAVAAEDETTARAAVGLLGAEWAERDLPDEPALENYLRSHTVRSAGWERRLVEEQGRAESALAASPVRLEATYRTAYLAHVSLEPRVALARWTGGRLTVITGAQQPFAVRRTLASALGVDERKVRVLVPDFGGGFGSKHTEDVALMAALLSRTAGRPVRLALNRDEEFRHTYFRPAAVIDVASGADSDGTITAWRFSNLNGGTSALRPPYRIEHQRLDFHPAASPLPQGPYRALAATGSTFAREVHLDELSEALGLDPLDLRLRNLDDERLAAVLEAVAVHAGWERRQAHRRRPGSGMGIACGMEKDGRVATCVEVRLEDDLVRVMRVVTAFDCGAIVHPDNVRRQIEGATLMGLGGALHEAVHFKAGRMTNASLRDYELPRFLGTPRIEVILLDRRDVPSAGAGETPMIAVAPALAAAIHAAGGPRLRSLPLTPGGRLPDLAAAAVEVTASDAPAPAGQ